MQNTRRSSLSVCLLTLLSFCLIRPVLAQVRFQGLGDLPGGEFYSEATGISADGNTVVGSSKSGNGLEAYLWTASVGLRGLGFLPGNFESHASGTSADGSVVVGFSRTGDGIEAFRWTQSNGMTGLGFLSDHVTQSKALNVSADGTVIVGGSGVAEGVNYQSAWRAFRWVAGNGLVNLGTPQYWGNFIEADATSADGRVIVGGGDSPSGTEAFLWTQETGIVGLGDLPGGAFYSHAAGVSADGSVIVGWGSSSASSANFEYEAFRWTQASGMVGLGSLSGSVSSYATGVSADGSIVVGYSHNKAFIWDTAHGMRDLSDVLVNDYGVNLTGWNLQQATAVSADGMTIVGNGVNPSGQNEAWIAHLGTFVSGKITLQSSVDQAQPLTFEFRPTDGSASFTKTLTLNADRTFTLTGIPKKQYDVWIKGVKWLAKVVSVDATNGDVSGVKATLLAGDADDNNVVDFDDLTILAIAYNTMAGDPLFDDRADFNCDGQVEFEDLTLLAINYNLEGDP